MTLLPEDEPFGVATGLQAPSAEAAARAKALFEKMLSGDMPSVPLSTGAAFGGGRRYDVALSLVPAAAPALPDAMFDEVTQALTAPVAEAPAPEAFSEPAAEVTQMMPARPPTGAPMVRRGAPQPAPAAPVAQALLEETVDTAMFWHEPTGGQTFQLAFRDEVFKEVSCTLTVVKGRVTATFSVTDDNQRRLLESEVGTLRVSLEQRGLKVDDIRVVLEGTP